MEFNSFWYLGLAALSILLLIYVYFKTRSTRILLHFITMIGLGYLIETVIYNIGHSYQYYPKLIKHDSIYDSNMGAIASNALALPVVATFIAALRKNWMWILFFVSLFAGIEWTFLKLNIYTHNWWKTSYTVFGLLLFYFPLAKLIYQLLSHPLQGKLHSIILFLSVSPISASLQFIPVMFFSIRYYDLGWFERPSEDTTAFGSIYYLFACLFYVWIAKQHWKLKWLKYALTALLMFAVNLLLQKIGILHSQVWWDPWYYVVLSVFIVKCTVTFSTHIATGPQKNA